MTGDGGRRGGVTAFDLFAAHKAAKLLLPAIVIAVAVVIVDDIVVATVRILHLDLAYHLHREGQVNLPGCPPIPVGDMVIHRRFVVDLDRAAQPIVHTLEQEGLRADREIDILHRLVGLGRVAAVEQLNRTIAVHIGQAHSGIFAIKGWGITQHNRRGQAAIAQAKPIGDSAVAGQDQIDQPVVVKIAGLDLCRLRADATWWIEQRFAFSITAVAVVRPVDHQPVTHKEQILHTVAGNVADLDVRIAKFGGVTSGGREDIKVGGGAPRPLACQPNLQPPGGAQHHINAMVVVDIDQLHVGVVEIKTR